MTFAARIIFTPLAKTSYSPPALRPEKDFDPVMQATPPERRIRALSIVYNLFRAGHENRLLSLGQTIDRQRFDYRVLSVTREATDPATLVSTLRPDFQAIGIPVDDLDIEQDTDPNPAKLGRVLKAIPAVARIISRLVRYIRQNQIDVIDAHHTTAMFAAVLAGRLTGVPVFLSSYHVRNWEPLSLRPAGQLALGSAQAIVSDSHARATDIRNFLWRKSVPIQVIPTGVETPVAQRSAAEVRSILGLPADPSLLVIGCVAGIVPSKGQMVLLEAAIEILKVEPNVVFLCVGNFREFVEYEQQLRQRIRDNRLESRFVIGGYPHSIGDVWQLIDIHTHPTMFDSLPLGVLEAMASGKPIVATTVGGIPEVIAHEQTGLLIPPGDSKPLAEALLRLIRDPQLRSRLGAAARDYHQQHLTPAAMARSIEQLYETLAKPRH